MRRLLAMLALFPGCVLAQATDGNPYADPPPLAATHAMADCPVPRQPVLTPEQARSQAHSRIERGTACALAGTCEPGGAYKHDGEITARVAAVIGADARFADTSLWVETLRRFVTIKGCLRDAAQGEALGSLVKTVPGVELVWQEAVVWPMSSR